MVTRTLEDLGFTTVCKELRGMCLSEEGAGLIDEKRFVLDAAELATEQDLVSDLLTIQSTGVPQPEQFPEIGSILEELSIPEGRLDGEKLFSLAGYIRSARLLAQFCQTSAIPFGIAAVEKTNHPAEVLFPTFAPSLIALENKLLDVLESPGTVKSTHPAIRRLKAEIERKRAERQSFSLDFLHSQREVSQGEQPVFRDGRVVLPIKNDQRGSVPGFIHSASASGATVFVEPYRLVELNNQVVMAEQQVLIEIARILLELSHECRACLEELRDLVIRVARADALYARARYVQRYNCIRALHSEDGSYRLIRARHPLLKSKAVPITLELEASVKAVVISGPNAGGKTVTIKTMGLFALLNQFLYFVPASDGTTIPIYQAIYTDIGDDQSIEDSLSTFSGHMRQIGEILGHCDNHSLVILDELGSGTDPVEGSALARAVMEYCVENAALTLVTSHHAVLKQYAYAHDEVLNASMEFDNNTHEPTFKVISGIPGDSHALDTARRMRLPETVINAAERYLGAETLEISSIIKGLEQRRKEADQREAELAHRARLLQDEVRRVDLKQLALRQQEELIRRNQIGDISRFISEKRSELENLVAELREGEITREKTLRVKAFIAALEEKELDAQRKVQMLRDKNRSERPASENPGIVPTSFGVGVSVLVGPQRREGKIVRKEKGDSWLVAIGPIKFTLPESDLTIVSRARSADKKKFTVMYESKAVMPKFTVDVRGMTLEQALEVVVQQIEGALVHSVAEFSIIHGMGDGILSKGIHQYLKEVPQVTDFHFARPEDGGFGKTYVVL
ncbi:MAG: endonuclease MutS2 [Spirochaetae bacterium HGW-Spirochaetae-8]|nr:MAG: endonuclease MutS2 [Spirochaetae bacterium HGW-Spirochaetae-8]